MLNPIWAKNDTIYIALFIKNKLAAILKPTENGYVYAWHYKYNIPQYVVPVNPEVNPHVKYLLIGPSDAANLTYEI